MDLDETWQTIAQVGRGLLDYLESFILEFV